MALKRNLRGQCSATAVVAILGGDDYQGGLKSSKVVTRYEHYLRAAQMIQAHQSYEDFESSVVGSSVVVGDQVLDSIEVHVYMGDATNDELVQKKKVHVGFVFSAQAEAADLKQYIEEA